MSITFEDSMVWSKLCWDKSWEKCIDLDDVLPKANQVYPVTLRKSNSRICGIARLLWKPPHSDLNGWNDIRPSEISKSYVLDGVLSNPSINGMNFDFHLLNRTKLLDVFDQADKDEVSPLRYFEDEVLSDIGKEKRWLKSAVGEYTYIFNSGQSITAEIILSRVGQDLCVHFVAFFYEFSGNLNAITNYTPSKHEHYLLESILEDANEVFDTSYNDVGMRKILGAEYQ